MFEYWGYANRKHLYDVLQANEMENVVLLTGDAHLGIVWEAECSSFTGQRVLPEITSSGLSHSMHDSWPFSKNIFNKLSIKDSIASDLFIDLNYGYLEIKRANDSSEPLVKASIRGIDG